MLSGGAQVTQLETGLSGSPEGDGSSREDKGHLLSDKWVWMSRRGFRPVRLSRECDKSGPKSPRTRDSALV